MQADKLLKTSLQQNVSDCTVSGRARIFGNCECTSTNLGVHEEVGQLLQVHIFPKVLNIRFLDSIRLVQLATYKSEHGHVKVPQRFKTPDSCPLGSWVSVQRRNKAKGTLCPELEGRLDALGMVWDPLLEDWEDKLGKLVAYKSDHGDVRVPFKFKTADGSALGIMGVRATHKQSQGQIMSRA